MNMSSDLRSLRLAVSSAIAVGVLAACDKATPADAYGNFEAEEVVVGAESSGQLQRFTAVEGQTLAANTTVALIDTIAIALDRAQLVAQRKGLVAHRAEVSDQSRALQVQLEIARRARARIERLYAGQAATSAQRDQAEREERVLVAQNAAAGAGLTRVDADVGALDARIAAIQDRLRRATVVNPVNGTVITTYVRAGEMVQPGQPLYRVANLDTLTLRAYVTGAQLGAFRLGSVVDVKVDATTGAAATGSEGSASATLRTYRGTIAWVSARAEFTPTPVQTRDDRRDLVYAVKIRVANPDGALKVGMPGDVSLSSAVAAAPASTPKP